MRIALHDPAAWPLWFTRTLIVALALLLYSGALGYPLIGLDDVGYYGNSALAGGGWRGLAAMWTTMAMSDYAPVSQLTVWADLAIAGEHWWFAHLQQILWFALGGCAVHALALRLGVRPGPAAAVALLYILHPLGGESVLWLAERKNLVALALCLWCVERYAAAVQGGSWRAAAAAWALGACALLAKPHAVCLPLLLTACEIALGVAPWRRRLLRLAPPALLVAVYVAVQLLYLRSDLDRSFLAGSRLGALAVDGQILLRYLAEVVLPSQLTIYYSAPESVEGVRAALAWAGVLTLVAVSLMPRRTRALSACAWLGAGGALAPALNLVPQLAPCADHYLLWALPWLLLLLVVHTELLLGRRAETAGSRPSMLLCGGAGLYLGLLALVRLPEFASREALFRAAVRHQPDCGIGWAQYIVSNAQHGGDLSRLYPAATRALQCADSGRILPEDRAMVIVLSALALNKAGDATGADALVEREVARLPVDSWGFADIVRAQVALRSGAPVRAVALLQRFYPQELRAAAGVLRTRCRGGGELPDAIPPLIDFAILGGAAVVDSINLEHGRDNYQRQLQTLAFAYLASGELEPAFDVAALALNMAPGSAEARQLLITIARKLHLDDLAALLGGAPGASAPPLGPPAPAPALPAPAPSH